MINLTNEELKQLERIGSGNFGIVYRKGDKAYKIYNEYVKETPITIVSNPSLKYSQRRLNRLMSLNGKLKYTDLIEDIIFVDDNFKGVVTPYYEGPTLSQLAHQSLEVKLPIAKELVRNARELTQHFIYPMDYKLNNLILAEDGIKIIDLDDVLTKVSILPNTLKAYESITELDKTIKTYFNEYQYRQFYFEGAKELEKKRSPLNFTYSGIEQYIEQKGLKHNYIFVIENANIKGYIELLRNKNYRVVYVYDHFFREDAINRLFELGIDLYDIIEMSELKSYINSTLYDECLEVTDNKVLRIEKNVKRV